MDLTCSRHDVAEKITSWH